MTAQLSGVTEATPDERLAQLAAPTATGTDTRPRLSPFTRAEHRIATMLAAGMGTTEIARQARVSPKTVASHLERMFLKADARTRTHLVATAIRKGWIR